MSKTTALKLASILSALTVAGCASTGVQTTSGIPEVTINAPAQKVKAAILASVRDATLVQETEHTLVYSGQMGFGEEFLTRAALGSAYSSQPKYITTYTIVPLGENVTRVTGHIAIDMKSAFGAEQ